MKIKSLPNDFIIWLIILAFIGIINKYNIYNLNFVSISSKLFYVVIGIFVILVILRLVIRLIIKSQKRNKYINSGISVVDKMKGNEFEKFLLAHFEKLGYKGRLTNESNDYGADILVKKDGDIIVVQAKRYSSKVGIKAIQELVASLQYYHATKGIVVTNNYFTKNAIALARANNIELWERKKLTEIMNKNGSKGLADQTIAKTKIFKECPECSGSLILKNGAYGQFYGCSNFPKCKFTRAKE